MFGTAGLDFGTPLPQSSCLVWAYRFLRISDFGISQVWIWISCLGKVPGPVRHDIWPFLNQIETQKFKPLQVLDKLKLFVNHEFLDHLYRILDF